MAQTKRIVLFVAGGAAMVALAYFFGTQAAGILKDWNAARHADEYRAEAAEQTAAVLRRMGTIKVGDTLANFPLEDIDGKLHLLSELVTNNTLITYVKPDCDACLEEMEQLRSSADDPDDYKHVILITSANPLHMHRIRQDYGLRCAILYDEERQFGAALKIQTFPFNLVVDRNRVIQQVHANVMLAEDYRNLFESGDGAHPAVTSAQAGAQSESLESPQPNATTTL